MCFTNGVDGVVWVNLHHTIHNQDNDETDDDEDDDDDDDDDDDVDDDDDYDDDDHNLVCSREWMSGKTCWLVKWRRTSTHSLSSVKEQGRIRSRCAVSR